MAKILLVDDELTMVQMVAEVLRAEGHEVFPFTTFNGVVDALGDRHPDLVITDLYLDKTKPGGMDIIRKARQLNPPALVIMITGFGTVESAVEAMKLGAYDYLEKPFRLEDLKLCVHRALNYTQAIQENKLLRRELKQRYGFSRIIGASNPMQAVFRMVERVAGTDATVLILGESGTGKELVARALHYNSRRSQGPFIPINCSALPENLLE
jgi:DNA-binding NtrC family response regulator